MDFREQARSCLIESADIIKRQADEIVSDFEDENVNEVYITIRVNGCDVPSLEIQKSYIPVRRQDNALR